jgi:hypothetical protein
MSRLFKAPKIETPPPAATVTEPPKVPTVDTAVRVREEEDNLRRKKRRGRAATMLTGSDGAAMPQTATQKLLGS